jgi:hypothetical protein
MICLVESTSRAWDTLYYHPSSNTHDLSSMLVRYIAVWCSQQQLETCHQVTYLSQCWQDQEQILSTFSAITPSLITRSRFWLLQTTAVLGMSAEDVHRLYIWWGPRFWGTPCITTLLASVDSLYYHPSCQFRNNTPYEDSVLSVHTQIRPSLLIQWWAGELIRYWLGSIPVVLGLTRVRRDGLICVIVS